MSLTPFSQDTFFQIFDGVTFAVQSLEIYPRSQRFHENEFLKMNVLHIINASKMGELKSLGSYAQVKYALESELGNKLGCSGWLSLFNKLTFLKSVVPSSKDDLLIACEAASLRISISKVSSILGLKVKAETRSELAGVVRRFIAMFPPTTFDPYQHYEKTKFAKFKGSSKLEGIDIRHLDDKVTLDSLLNKHRR